ncbi:MULTISPECIES: DUF488 domain-containing protein [unclassified Streptomyces]|uniref:DUF488 domain-containing protein n=1 Tax=unclassified Streptomyces TaxID=2593676 RepID=UPI001BE660E3|nr:MULTISPECIES: DUF488 family protein [unclassified Streptomyces]MBT2402670.1 DUF488 family protein [Streptomyces sp. ISL-21]MBT2458690.1 DUF488 family protein [Streptomyces sp. ISL-86]MBT2611309.1 DUF488 family protein [Streptomyces sp. ISL-87]
MTSIRLRRVYDPPEPGADGVRVLVDRLWPRGLAKAEAAVDEWPKAVTPSSELRKWFHAGGSEEEFRARYEAELEGAEAVAGLERLRALAAEGPVTLLTAVKDPGSSHAAVLAELLG